MIHKKHLHSVSMVLRRGMAFLLVLGMTLTTAFAMMPEILSTVGDTAIGDSSTEDIAPPPQEEVELDNEGSGADLPDVAMLLGETPAPLSQEVLVYNASLSTVVVVSTPEELRAVAERVNAGDDMEGITVDLVADLDLSNIQPWTPIGSDVDTPFSGNFHGNGYSIKGLKTTTSSGEELHPGGLFGFLVGAEIRDVLLVDPNTPSASNGVYFAKSSTLVTGVSSRSTLAVRRSMFTLRAGNNNSKISTWNGGTIEWSTISSKKPEGVGINSLERTYVLIDANSDQYNAADVLAYISQQSKDKRYDANGKKIYLQGTFDLNGVDENGQPKNTGTNNWSPLWSYSENNFRGSVTTLTDIIGINCVIKNMYSTKGGLIGRIVNGSNVRGITMLNPYIARDNQELRYENTDQRTGSGYGDGTGIGNGGTFPKYYYTGAVGAIVNQVYLGSVSDCAVVGGTIKGPKVGGIVGAISLSFGHNRPASLANCAVIGATLEAKATGEALLDNDNNGSATDSIKCTPEYLGGVGGIAYHMDATSMSRCTVVNTKLIGKHIGGLAFGINGTTKQGNDSTSSVGVSECVVLNVTASPTDLQNSSVSGLFARAYSDAAVGYNVVSACHVDEAIYKQLQTAGANTKLNFALASWGSNRATSANTAAATADPTKAENYTTTINNFFTDSNYDDLLFVNDLDPGADTPFKKDLTGNTNGKSGVSGGGGIDELQYNLSGIVWDKTAAPGRTENTRLSGTEKEIAKGYAFDTTAITSTSFSQLDTTMWERTAGFYPRLKSLINDAKSENASIASKINAEVANMASLAVKPTDDAQNWYGMGGVILPSYLPDGTTKVTWSGKISLGYDSKTAQDVTDLVGHDRLADLTSADVKGSILDEYNRYNEKVNSFEDLPWGTVMEVLASLAQNGTKYVLAKEPWYETRLNAQGQLTKEEVGTAYYNLTTQSVYIDNLTANATSADATLAGLDTTVATAYKKNFGSLILNDCTLKENMAASSSSRTLENITVSSTNNIAKGSLNEKFFMEFEEAIKLNPNASLIEVDYSANNGKTWISAGAITPTLSDNYVLKSDSTKASQAPIVYETVNSVHTRVYFRFFDTDTIKLQNNQALMPQPGLLYRITIPAELFVAAKTITNKVNTGKQLVDQDVKQDNYSNQAQFYFRTTDSYPPTIVEGPYALEGAGNGHTYVNDNSSTQKMSNLKEWLRIQFSGVTYALIEGNTGEAVNKIPEQNILVLTNEQIGQLINVSNLESADVKSSMDALAAAVRSDQRFDYNSIMANPYFKDAATSAPLVILAFSPFSRDQGDADKLLDIPDGGYTSGDAKLKDFLTTGPNIPKPGQYTMSVLAISGQWINNSNDDVRVTHRNFTMNVDGPVTWGEMLDPDKNTTIAVADANDFMSSVVTPTTGIPAEKAVRHYHVNLSDAPTPDDLRNYLKTYFKAKAFSGSGAESLKSDSVFVDFNTPGTARNLDAWQGMGEGNTAANEEKLFELGKKGIPFRVTARISLKNAQGQRILPANGAMVSGTPDKDPIYVEVYVDNLRQPVFNTRTVAVPVGSTHDQIKEAILRRIVRYKPGDGSDVEIDWSTLEATDFSQIGNYTLTLPVIAPQTVCTRPEAMMEPSATNRHNYIGLIKPIELVLNVYQPPDGNDNHFWNKVNYDIENSNTGNTVNRVGDWQTDMGIDTLQALQNNPYTTMRFSRDDIRWTVYGHEVSQYATDHFADHSRVSWFLGAEVIQDKNVLALTEGYAAKCVKFEQVGDFYFYVGFDMRVGSSNDGEKWYLYAYDKNQNKLRYICDALLDENGWANATLNKFYDATYVFSTLPPTSDKVMLGWNSDLPLGIHYGRNDFITDLPQYDDPFNPYPPQEVTPTPDPVPEQQPDTPSDPNVPSNPSGPVAADTSAWWQNPWLAIILALVAIAVAVTVLVYRKRREGIN